MKRKLLNVAIVCMILATVLGACDKGNSGRTGNIKWKVDKEGTLTIRGKGAMPENGFSWYYVEDKINAIVIEEGVTTIGAFAFGLLPYLTSVTIANTAISIGDRAFQGCINLDFINIPNNVITIENETFAECHNLTAITFPNSVTKIVGRAFRSCENINSITCHNPVPADIDLWTFRDINKNTCTLKVPASAVSAYQNADGWKEFKNIVGM